MARSYIRYEGTHYRFHQLEFWAQDGFIKVRAYDKEPPEDADCYVDDFLERALSINREISHIPYADERNEFHNLVEAMILCAKEARQKGALDDPGYLDWVTTHRPFFQNYWKDCGSMQTSGRWFNQKGDVDNGDGKVKIDILGKESTLPPPAVKEITDGLNKPKSS